MESSSAGDDREGSGDMEVEIADRMEDPPRELIPVIEEDSDDIPILKENRDPIPVPPPRIGNTGKYTVNEPLRNIEGTFLGNIQGVPMDYLIRTLQSHDLGN